MILHFHKFQGTGNDFILLDIRENNLPMQAEVIKFLCDRRMGIGADGLITLNNDDDYLFFMRYYNSDGQESTMCGNGGRCITLFARQLKIGDKEFHFKAIDGVHTALILEAGDDNALVKLKMKDVSEVQTYEDYALVDTGSPHCVVFTEDVQNLDVLNRGREIRYSEQFTRKGINVDFAEINNTGLFVRTYERGVEDETLSCGTGVTASVLAAVSMGIDLPSPVQVLTLGGRLYLHYKQKQQAFSDVWLEGPAMKVFTGTIDI